MTDYEARTEIEQSMADCAMQLGHGCERCAALAHALTAIEDRAALVAGDDAWAYLPAQDAVAAARSHMKGEP